MNTLPSGDVIDETVRPYTSVQPNLSEHDLLQIQPDPYIGLAREHISAVQSRLGIILPAGYETDGVLGFGNSSVAWRVRDNSGQIRVLKVVTPEESHQIKTHAVMTQLAHHLGLPVGRIIQYGDDWCIEEMVSGDKLKPNEPHYEHTCSEVGAHIAQLHSANIDEIGALKKAGVKSFCLDEHREKTYKCQDIVSKKVGAGNWQRMVRQLREPIQNEKDTGNFVPCNADITHDNLFVDDVGHITGMIDFGSGMLGPRERDFASMMRMEIMGVVDFPLYQLTKDAYELKTGIKLDEELIKKITLFKCMRKIVKWKNSPEKMIKALKYLLGDNFKEEEIDPLWGKNFTP